MSTVLTVGHSNKPVGQFLHLLQGAGVQTVWDIRSRPYSRWNPQFNRERLRESLQTVGISYQYWGDRLGGLDGNSDPEGALDELASSHRTLIMCSEGDPANCHRRTWVTPGLVTRGCNVLDLLWSGEIVDTQTGQLF